MLFKKKRIRYAWREKKYRKNDLKFCSLMKTLLILCVLLHFGMTVRQSYFTSSVVETYVNSDTNKTSLPVWMQDYVDYHNSQIPLNATVDFLRTRGDNSQALTKKTKYLVWACRTQGDCGGVGDRLSGIIQAFYMAMCTNRVLLVLWNVPAPLSNYLKPHRLQWNVLYPSSPSHQVISTVDNRQNGYLLEPSNLPANTQVIELRNNLWLYEPIVRRSQCMKNYWKSHGSTDDTTDLYRSAFWTLFQWTDDVLDRSLRLKESAGIRHPFIGVHIRTGKGESWEDPVRHGGDDNLRLFHQCARKVQRGIQERCGMPKPDIYVAADHAAVKQQLHAWDTDHSIKTPSNLEIYHLDRTAPEQLHNHTAAEQDLWAEVKVLMDATCLVTSNSKFSFLATWLSPQQPRCAVLFNECSNENVTRALQALKGASCDV